MTKKATYIIGFIVLAALTVLPAPALAHKGDVNVIPIQLEQRDDSLYVLMEIQMPESRVKSKMSIDLTPRLISADWDTDLPVISIKGRRNYKAFERGLALEGMSVEAFADNTENLVVKGYGNRDNTIDYKYAMAFESWMADAKLDLVRNDAGCGNSHIVSVYGIADSVVMETPTIIHVPPQPILAFARPEAEEVKSREIYAECKLDFLVNKADINPSYMNNMGELLKVQGIIDELRNDPSISIVGLEIIGYASPEGSFTNNKRLSESRAMALRNYLTSQYDFPADIYTISFGGENWDGLVDALDEIDIDYKDEILDIINNISIEDGRESKLMALRGGAPYRYMLKNIFPDLRAAICRIKYSIKGFEAQDALEVLRTRPHNLSLNEFYMVANILEIGSPEFIEVFEIAVQMYPKDKVANLNAALAALQSGNTEVAEKHLNEVDGIPEANAAEYYNAMGVLSWMSGDLDNAKSYFRKAEAAGLAEADINLKEINKLELQ